MNIWPLPMKFVNFDKKKKKNMFFFKLCVVFFLNFNQNQESL